MTLEEAHRIRKENFIPLYGLSEYLGRTLGTEIKNPGFGKEYWGTIGNTLLLTLYNGGLAVGGTNLADYLF